MRIRTYSELTEADASGLPEQIREQGERIARRLSTVRHLVAVLSGKGGVGKSFVAAALATAARRAGWRVGLLDADLNGPTALRFLGGRRASLRVEEGNVAPAVSPSGIAFFSMDLLLEEGAPLEWREPGSETFVWRGAQERGAVREFLGDVAWGERDLLLVDLPPGTQRLVELVELAPDVAGALVVTLPSAASWASVHRSVEVARRRGVPILGVVENMSAYACSGCGGLEPLFSGQGGARLAAQFGVPLLGRIPFDPRAAALADEGKLETLLGETRAGAEVREVAERLRGVLESGT
ncbi:MAG: P-loop NTPase [Gemmatimonadota bacterium]